MQADQQLENI